MDQRSRRTTCQYLVTGTLTIQNIIGNQNKADHFIKVIKVRINGICYAKGQTIEKNK